MRLFIVRSTILLLILFFLFPANGQSMEDISVSANNAVLIEETTGRILFEKQAHERKPVASITKVMTAIIAIEQGELNEMVKASQKAIHTEGSSIYLQKDEKMSLEDLLYGLMLRSGNDAAVAIAEHIGGSEEGFVYLMNEKAKYLGMTNSSFKNPHGLDEEGHYSSAYDIAILMKYAMENETFKKISGTEDFLSDNRTYKWRNKNKLLTQYYEHCTGGKTGFTKKAGRTLVTTASDKKLSLIAVTLNGPDDWNDHTALFEYGFNEHELIKLESKGKRTFVSEETFLTGRIKEDILYPLRKDEQTVLRKQAFLKQLSDETVPSDNKMGTIIYSINDENILEVPVYYTVSNKESIWEQILHAFNNIIRFDSDG